MADFRVGDILKIVVFYPCYIHPQSQQSEPALKSEVVMIGQELLPLENGEYEVARKVRLGKETVTGTALRRR